jgi:hypothetical protein
VNRPVEMLRGGHTAIRERLLSVSRQSERTMLLGGILLLSAVSGAMAFVLAQYFSIDVLSSLLFPPKDCWADSGIRVGQHCFSDYGWAVNHGMQPNPWRSARLYPGDLDDYLAVGMLPPMFFALLSRWLHAPAAVGLFAYLFVLTVAVLAPAVWAARGTRGLERVVIFVACGVAAIPAWAVIDRANSTGFLAPIALVFLVALCRKRWGIVAIMAVLAAAAKPQFVVLAVVLFVARQWRLGAFAVTGTLVSNYFAYLIWPDDYPDTIGQSINNALHHGDILEPLDQLENVSFAKGLLALPDGIAQAPSVYGPAQRVILTDGPRSLIGYGVLAIVIVSVLVLGRRIAPVMAGIALLATASLFPAMSYGYYLVFALPVAALVVRGPDGPPGSGLFDRPRTPGDRRRAVGVCVSLAAVISIAQVALPGPRVPISTVGVFARAGEFPPPDATMVWTTSALAPTLWLLAIAVIIASYARRPAPQAQIQESRDVAKASRKHDGAPIRAATDRSAQALDSKNSVTPIGQ